jgi:hypothetical protein
MSFQAGTYDFFDDHGEILKKYFPSLEEVPEIIKQASEVGQASPNNMFALVLVEEDQVMKKFATADPGHTFLSTIYFLNTYDRLPKEAQKVAAANLKQACEMFDLDPPRRLTKLAEGTEPGPNLVDVSGQTLEPQVVERKDTEFAIERADGSQYFPLDSAASVKAADDYFQRNVGSFVPRERREYAVKVASVAEKGSLPLSQELRHYASDQYNPALMGYLDVRMHHLVAAESLEAQDLLTKLASVADTLSPTQFVEYLERFDRSTGLDALWDAAVPDPWYSTFGLPDMEKLAKGDAASPETYTLGVDTVTEEELKNLAARGFASLKESFGESFASAFRNNPLTQFKASPLPQKKVLMRLASEHLTEGSTGN